MIQLESRYKCLNGNDKQYIKTSAKCKDCCKMSNAAEMKMLRSALDNFIIKNELLSLWVYCEVAIVSASPLMSASVWSDNNKRNLI
jgi:1,2-phenylacetyl-CoA epoxidase PaaB subunit